MYLTSKAWVVLIALLVIVGAVVVFIFRPWEIALTSLVDVYDDYETISAVSVQEDDENPLQEVRGNTVGNNVNGGIAAKYGDWIFYISTTLWGEPEPRFEPKLTKVKNDGSERQVILSEDIFGINVVDGWLIFGIFSGASTGIHRMRIDGTEREHLSIYVPSSINVVDGWIFYSNGNYNWNIYKMRIDGSEHQRINTDNSASFSVSNGWIYYVNMDENQSIYKIRIDGTERRRINDDISSRPNIIEGWIFYTNFSNNGFIYKIRADGTDRQMVIDDMGSNINVSNGWIYYSNIGEGGLLYKIRIDGTEQQRIAEIPVRNITIIDTWIYVFYGNVYEAHLPHGVALRIAKSGNYYEILDNIGGQ